MSYDCFRSNLFQANQKTVLSFFLLLLLMPSFSFATNYYIDNISGSNSNNGTSMSTPWADFTNVNSKTFSPGDQLLLKSGCVWNQELHFKGSGTSTSFIVIDSYGGSTKAKIQRNSQAGDRTVFLENNPSYLKVRNLEICNAGNGIKLTYSSKGNTSVYFQNLYIHDINLIVNGSPATDGTYYSTGITIENGNSPKPATTNDYVAADIQITNCEIALTTAPFTFLHIFTNPSGSNTESPYSFKNCLVDNNYLHDFKGPISTRDLNNSKITNNNCKNGGTTPLPQGTTGFFNFNLENVVFEGNVMDNVPNTGSSDQSWIDNEAYCNNVQFYGNNIKNTAGNGVEFLNCPGCQPPRGNDDYNVNNVIDGNTFANNSNGVFKTNAGGPSGTLTNNFYQSGNTLFNGTSSGFAQINNTATDFNTTNLARYKAYISSSVFDGSQRPSKAFDGNASSDWQAASGFANQWLRINFGASVTFDSVRLSEFGNRTTGYRIEYSTDGINWQTAYTGTTIGNSSAVTFTAVTATMARIYFTGGVNTPIIYEFEVYKKPASGGSSSIINIGNASDGMTYGGSGFFNTRTGDINADERFLTNSTSYCQYTFTGTGVDVIGYKDQGSIYAANYTIFIDGSAVINGNTSSSTNQFQVVFGSISGLSNASHTVKIAFASAIGSSPCVILDGLRIYSASGTSANLALNRTYTSSSNWDASQTAEKGCDGTTSTDWQAANGTTFNGQYLQVNFGTAVTFNRVTLSEYANRTSGYRIEYSSNGSTWQTAFIGTTIGTSTSVNFTSVTGNYARIFFTSGVNTPIIYEFEIYNVSGARVVPGKSLSPPVSNDIYPITLFPNPARSLVNIGYQLPLNSDATVSLFDMRGRKIKETKFVTGYSSYGKIRLDVSELTDGIYTVKINAGTYSASYKLMIQR
jgi:F5/8 type C domain/Secretion system C-terminal sorting domain